MSAPNILELGTITGKTNVQAVGSTAAAVLENAAESGTVHKVNSIIASNVDGTAPVWVSVYLSRNSVNYHLASEMTIPAKASLVVLNKETPIYLEEGDSLFALADDASNVELICSYEILAS